MNDQSELIRSPRIVIVGVCASGKSSLVKGLRDKGYDAHAAAQEHSYVPNMWQMTHPEVLIYLDANMGTIRKRRFVSWGIDHLREQKEILRHAREHCHLYINTNSRSQEEVLQETLAFLTLWKGSRL